MLKDNQILKIKIRMAIAWALGIAVAFAITLLGWSIFDIIDRGYYREYSEAEFSPSHILFALAGLIGYYVGTSAFHGSFSTWLSTDGKIKIEEWMLGLTVFLVGLAWLGPRVLHTQPHSTFWMFVSFAWTISVVFFFMWRTERRKQNARIRADLLRDQELLARTRGRGPN